MQQGVTRTLCLEACGPITVILLDQHAGARDWSGGLLRQQALCSFDSNKR